MSIYIETMQENPLSTRAQVLLSCGPTQIAGAGKIGLGLIRMTGSGLGVLCSMMRFKEGPVDEGALIPRLLMHGELSSIEERIDEIRNRQRAEQGARDLSDGITLLLPFVGYTKYAKACDERSIAEYKQKQAYLNEISELQVRVRRIRSRL